MLTRIIVILFLLSFIFIGIIAFLFVKNDSDKKNLNDNNFPHYHHHYSDNEKTELFNKLKEIINSPEYIEGPLNFQDYINTSSRGNSDFFLYFDFHSEKDKNLIYWLSKGEFNKRIYYSQLGKENWQLLTKIIRERNKIRKQNEQKKTRDFRKKIKDLGVFYRLGQGHDGKGNITFSTGENTYIVVVDKRNPALSSNNLKDGIYQITDLENILTQKKPWHCSCSECQRERPFSYEKYVKAEDLITIKPYLKNHSL